MVVLLLGLASGNGAYVVLLLSINDMEVIQDIPPEAELAESDVATYASLNNDLNGTKADQEADVPGLHNLAVAIIYWINSTSFKMEGPTNMYKCSGSVGFIGGMQPLITPTAPLIAASTKSDVTL